MEEPWKPSHPDDTKPGLNEIVVRTMQYGLQRMLMERDVAITMRDGVTLYVNVFRPLEEERYPVVMSADVYGKDSVGQETHERFATHGAVKTSLFTPFESPDPGYWVPNDYVVVKVALRGSSNSGGDLYAVSSLEAQDYYECIEWAAAQPWSNGNVGLNGVSYLCMTQWPVMALNPPHLKAVIPWEGVSDMYRDWSFHGGIPETSFNPYWYENQKKRWGAGHFIEDIPSAMKEHPLIDDYWRDKMPDLTAPRMPMYVCASWSTQGLHTRGTLEGFKQASSEHKWLEIHGRKEWEVYYSREALERQRRFFDHFLKGEDNDWMDTPRVRLEVRERFYDNVTRFENEWPLARTRYTPLYLDGARTTLETAPVAEESTAEYMADAHGGKINAFFTHAFEQDTELTGPMKLKLWVAAKGADDMDLFVGIRKLDRRGREVHFPDLNHIEHGHVASGWLRVSHRELDPARSTPGQPWLRHERIQKLAPGEIVPCEVEILPSGTLFRAGESLVLVIQGSDLLSAEPQLPPLSRGQSFARVRCGHADTVNKGTHVIHTGGRYDSHLLVPVIPRRES